MTRPRSHFIQLPLRDLLHELLNNVSEAAVVRDAVRTRMANGQYSNLYELVEAQVLVEQGIPTTAAVSETTTNQSWPDMPTPGWIYDVVHTHELANAIKYKYRPMGFDPNRYFRRVDSSASVDTYIDMAAADPGVDSRLPEAGVNFWAKMRQSLFQWTMERR